MNKRLLLVIAALLLLIVFGFMVFHQPEKVTALEGRIPTGKNTIHFQYGLTLDMEAKAALLGVATLMNRDETISVTLIGHAADQGSEAAAYFLGEEFARAANLELVTKGIKSSRIVMESKGNSEPLVRLPGEIDSLYYLRQNRVEIIINR